MIGYVRNLLGGREKPAAKGTPMVPEPVASIPRAAQGGGKPVQSYTKVFRYHLPDGQTAEPKLVEVVGTFTHWQKVPLIRDSKVGAWHVTLHHIPGNRTHHYMLLVDGRPTHDKSSDGLAIPTGPLEEQFQMNTDKGPRVLMLFAQTR